MDSQEFDPKFFSEAMEQLKFQLTEQQKLLEASQDREHQLILELKSIKEGNSATSSSNETVPLTSVSSNDVQANATNSSNSI